MNRQNIKISYSGTQSMGGQISSHNAKIQRDSKAKDESVASCNWQNSVSSCRLDGNYQVSAIVYKATVTADDMKVKT